jgi:hypothetical protein
LVRTRVTPDFEQEKKFRFVAYKGKDGQFDWYPENPAQPGNYCEAFYKPQSSKPVLEPPLQKSEHPQAKPKPRAEQVKRDTANIVQQRGQNNIAQVGNNNTATINAKTPPFAITEEQAAQITEALRPFAGRTMEMFVHNATPEAMAFGENLKRAVSNAGINVPSLGSGIATSTAGIPPGVSFLLGKNNIDLATAFAGILWKQGIVKEKVVARIIQDNDDFFDVTIAPP